MERSFPSFRHTQTGRSYTRMLAGVAVVFLTLGTVSGCAPKVERTSADTTVDLSGRWNDADSRMTAEALISDCLTRPWLGAFEQSQGKKPRVIIGSVVNKTNQHIATEAFVRDLERELTNAGRVVFVAGGNERDEIRGEREDQQYWSSEDTRKRMREEYGADYMLQGVVQTITDKAGNQQVVLYQIDLTLTDLQSNERVWLGNHKIKKEVKHQKARL